MLCHIIQSLFNHKCYGCLVTFVTIWQFQDCVEITGEEDLCTSGLVADCCNDVIEGGGIARRDVKTHHVPVPLTLY